MKVVYETVGTSIRKAVLAADASNRRIEYIELEWWEIEELQRECQPLAYGYGAPLRAIDAKALQSGGSVGSYMGVQVRKA